MSDDQQDSDLPKRQRRGEDTRRETQGTGDGRRAHAEEAKMRERYAREKEDANRQSIGNLRQEANMIRVELRTDLEKVSDASRERDKELHIKIDTKHEKFDDRLDELQKQVLLAQGEFTAAKVESATLKTSLANKDKGEFDDVPFYARPSYIKAMGMAIAAVIVAVLTSLGIIFKWGGSTPLPSPDDAHHEAPEDPGPEGD